MGERQRAMLPRNWRKVRYIAYPMPEYGYLICDTHGQGRAMARGFFKETTLELLAVLNKNTPPAPQREE